MICEPKLKNKAADFLILALFLCALVCVVFGNINGVSGRSVLQFVSLFFFCALIFVLVKYKFTRLRYTVRLKSVKGYGDEDEAAEPVDENAPIVSFPPEKLELIIETAQGKRSFICENSVYLDKIVEFCKIPEEKDKRAELFAKYKKAQGYKYLKNMVGAEKWLLAAHTDMGDIKIILEPDAKFAEYLSAVARYNRERGC